MQQFLQTKNNRLEYIDIAKGIGILLVVFGHSSLVLHIENIWIHSFHMPLFFIITGMCFNENKYSFAHFLKRRLHQIMVPCLFFTFFIASIEIIIGVRQLDSLRYGIPHALWFLPVLFVSQLVLYNVWVVSRKMVCRLTFITICLLAWFGIANKPPLPYTIQAIPAAIAFIGIGTLITVQEKKWSATQELALCFVASVVSVYVLKSRLNLYENDLHCHIIATIAAIMGSCFILALSKLVSHSQKERIKFIFIWLGRNSLVIMSIHQFFFYLGRTFVKSHLTFTPPILGKINIVYGIIELVVTLCISVLVIHFINKKLKWVVGK